MKRKTEKQSDWEATVQKVREATVPHSVRLTNHNEIYLEKTDGEIRYVGRIRRDRKVELVYGTTNFDDLGTCCDLRTDLRRNGLEVIEFVGLNGIIEPPESFLEALERDAKSLLSLSQRLKRAQTTYIPDTAKLEKLDEE